MLIYSSRIHIWITCCNWNCSLIKIVIIHCHSQRSVSCIGLPHTKGDVIGITTLRPPSFWWWHLALRLPQKMQWVFVLFLVCYFGREEKLRDFSLALLTTWVLIMWIKVQMWKFCPFLSIYSIDKLRIWADNFKTNSICGCYLQSFQLDQQNTEVLSP